jgi:hypothetical protein
MDGMSRSGRTLASVVVVTLSSWSCSSTAPDATPKVASIVVSPVSSTLALNARLPLQAQVQDGSGAVLPEAAVTWTVQDPKVVSVSTAGVVTALAIGTSQVAANALGRSGIATITVNPVTPNPGPSNPGPSNPGTGNPGAGNQGTGDHGAVTPGAVSTVTVSAPSKNVKRGSTMQLVATAKDNKGNTVPNQSFVWSSSNTNTATVSANGVVTGKRKGEVTVTARTSQSGGKSGSVKIAVK